MKDSSSWWRNRALLEEVLPFLNKARAHDEAIGRCETFCKALNRMWNAYFKFRGAAGQLSESETDKRSDSKRFRELLINGFGDEGSASLCQVESLRELAGLKPQVMNHDELLNAQYDPYNIADQVRKKASDEHQQLANAYERYSKNIDDTALQQALLKKASQLIYVVRSNIAHGEKTPKGPDIEKFSRDLIVSNATSKVIEDMFDILFDRPSERLAVYGTLAPEEANGGLLGGIQGEWLEGRVRGRLRLRDALREFRWETCSNDIPVRTFSSHELPTIIERIDRFEGSRHERILVPILINEVIVVGNIYQGKE